MAGRKPEEASSSRKLRGRDQRRAGSSAATGAGREAG